MLGHDFRQDRLCVLQVGRRRLALPLADVERFAPAHEVRAVAGAAPWVAGLLAERGAGVWFPVIDLARLWDDHTLAGPWTHVVITTAGLAIGAGGYENTATAHLLFDLRPAPANPALGRATILAGQPIPVVSTHHLIQPQEWQALAATA